MNKNTNNNAVITIKCVTCEKEFNTLKKEWNNLAQNIDDTCVYFRHEWVDAAWQWLRTESELYIICAYQRNTLCGVLPLVKKSLNRHFIPYIEVQFLSIPDTQRNDLISNSNHGDEIAEAIFYFLLNKNKSWDLIRLDKIAFGSSTINYFKDVADTLRLKTEVLDNGENPGITLEDSWDNFYSRRSRRLKKGNNHVANKIGASGKTLELKYFSRESIKDKGFDKLLTDIIGVSASSWKKDTGLTLDNPGPNAFIRQLTKHAYNQGWLSVWFVTLDGEPAAIEYQIDYNGYISALRADVNTKYNDLSPGTYLNWKMLIQLFNKQKKYYSMGPGNNKYKLRWAEELNKLEEIVCYNRTLKGSLFKLLELTIKPVAKTILGRTDNNK